MEGSGMGKRVAPRTNRSGQAASELNGNGSTQKLITALGHPTRREIVRQLLSEQAPLSPRQLTERIDESLSTVSYHFRILADAGVAKLVSTRPVRGSTEHFYEATSIEADWARALLSVDD
jgi:DNA-binding transcriptional ArsR family regulator